MTDIRRLGTPAVVTPEVVLSRLVLGLDQRFVNSFPLVYKRLGNDLAFHNNKYAEVVFSIEA